MLDNKRVDDITRRLFGISAPKPLRKREVKLPREPKDRTLREMLRSYLEIRNAKR